MAVFRLDGTAGIAETTTLIVLQANFAISAAGSGSIKRTVTTQTIAVLGLSGVTGTRTHSGTGIIKVAAALDEKATALDPVADVGVSFKKFEGGRTTASVGTLMVGIKEGYRNASGGDVDMLDAILVIANNTATPPAPSSTRPLPWVTSPS